MAGVKTNALVSLGSALFILLAAKITSDNSSSARIAAQIVTGIGFLGAGAIMKEGFNVSGLNTAATIWCSGAVGCLAGLGFWYEASIGTFFVIIKCQLFITLFWFVTPNLEPNRSQSHCDCVADGIAKDTHSATQ
jgi:uncharacterized membrane protein YhiD involved in acid resistance